MRSELLRLLKENSEHYLSGEQICRQLGVSRTAVWKQIQSLREMGYEIDARSNAGYRLLSVPDKLYPEEVACELSTRVIGSEFKYRFRVGSTNEEAKIWARQGAPDGAVYLAEEQGTGKGRLGRGWYSPPGEGLWFSVVLRPGISPAAVPQVTLLAAVAVARAIKNETGLVAGVKWPNDLLAGIKKRKLCGILTEMHADMDRVHYAVLGIGLNANLDPATIPVELQDIATSVAAEAGARVNRVSLLRCILRELDEWYMKWQADGPVPVLEEWKAWNVTLGREVKVTSVNNEAVVGKAIDLDESGALLVKLDSGDVKKFMAGEVSLRGN